MAKPVPARDCRPCTACCDGWLQIKVEGVPVYPGRPCPHSTGKGCNDYANRPVDPCVHFICGWRRDGSPLPEWMKPSNAKVIVLFDQSNWRGMPVDVAVPVGRRIPPRALNWLQQFAAYFLPLPSGDLAYMSMVANMDDKTGKDAAGAVMQSIRAP